MTPCDVQDQLQPVKQLQPGRKYVVGFAFDKTFEEVLLIFKKRPGWQAGKLNGVGGAVEDDDLVQLGIYNQPVGVEQIAMAREFNEEVDGLHTLAEEWVPYCELKDARGWSITFLYSVQPITNAIQKTDEQVAIFGVRDLHTVPVIPNLLWLIPMALTLHPQHPASTYQDQAGFFHVREAGRGFGN